MCKILHANFDVLEVGLLAIPEIKGSSQTLLRLKEVAGTLTNDNLPPKKTFLKI
jgi:hypothetical protein